jgi:hypothetical protein
MFIFNITPFVIALQKFIDGSISNNFPIFLPLAFILKSHDGLFYLGTQFSMAGHLWLQTINEVVRCMYGEKNVNSGLHTVLVKDEIGNPGW